MNAPLRTLQGGRIDRDAVHTFTFNDQEFTGHPGDTLASAKEFVAAYTAGGYSDPYEAYGAYAYDAANAIIEGLKTSLKDAKSVEEARQGTIDAIGKVKFSGVTGDVAFDEYGDTTSRVLTVYGVKGGKWDAVVTDTFK